MNNKEVMKKMFTSKFYWLGVITALTGFILVGYHGYKHNDLFIPGLALFLIGFAIHGYKHNDLFIPGLALFLIGFAIHGYNTIRAMAMMRRSPKEK